MLLQNSAQFGKRPSEEPKSIQSQFGKNYDPNLDRHSYYRCCEMLLINYLNGFGSGHKRNP